MIYKWSPSLWGGFFTSTIKWEIRLEDNRIGLTVEVEQGSREYEILIHNIDALSISVGTFWSTITFKPNGERLIRLDGIPNDKAHEMRSMLKAAHDRYEAEQIRLRHELEAIQTRQGQDRESVAAFTGWLARVQPWTNTVQNAFQSHKTMRRWLTTETISNLHTTKPSAHNFTAILQIPAVKSHIDLQSSAVKTAVDYWQADLNMKAIEYNQKLLESELIASQNFLNNVEKSPLTLEQKRAVICFDSRVQVIASAGSGKTSTMIAKAGYALYRDLVPAEQILLLAFNTEAAIELQKRICQRLEPLRFPIEKITATTFHAFGLSIIGRATGKKPSLAPWLENGEDIAKLTDIINELKSNNPKFRKTWNLFRIVFSRDLPKFNAIVEAEDWDSSTNKKGFRTLQGEVVKSKEELCIADWLFYNGIEYCYERSYEFDTRDPEHRQYRPDFFYPAAKAYHEHFALDAQGRPPTEFKGYLPSVKWKRSIHEQKGTTLWETTSATIRTGKAFDHLTKLLRSAGIKLKPDPNRPRPAHGRRVIPDKELVSTFRTFLTHVKSNNLSNADLQSKLRKTRSKKSDADTFHYRHKIFLQLFELIHYEWQRRLDTEKVIDFEDMLNMAASHLEANDWQSPFKLVMVDEFQDASKARARLVRALVRQPGCFLFAVGDDWQSINRFAGSDISVMTQFEEWFGKSQTLRLERTFRCPQSLCTLSSHFILKNPAQIQKNVQSTQAEFSPTLQAYQVSHENRLLSTIETHLEELHTGLSDGTIPLGKSNIVEIYILGRYRKDKEYCPPHWKQRFGELMNIKFMTIHASKGLEADYVILPRLTKGIYGFPSSIVDDPVLQLAMPEMEPHLYAEERRLFYVALTRARRNITLFTIENQNSDFITELIKDHQLIVTGMDGNPVLTLICSSCQQGLMIQRTNRRDGTKFWACNRFPMCNHTARTLRDSIGNILQP